jgi:NAD(P)-dependent dehydrogenase (short-subunit alcohol dehydrogenase family)
MELEDKVSIITGGSGGIGKAIAKAFAREGSHLILNSRTASELEATKREIEGLSPVKVEIFPADISQAKQVKDLVDFTLERFATVDILVNCAGVLGPVGLSSEVDAGKWLEAIQINPFGTFLCIQAVLPIMMKNKKGKIINFSGGGAVSPRPRFSAYSTSKAAVVRLTETLAGEVSEHNIDINAIAPGAVNTKLLDEVLKAGKAAGKEELAKAIKQKQEGGTPPEKAAELAVFLASPKSDGLTGRLISVVWDNWQEIPKHLDEIMSSDIYTMRRITPKDKGQEWT